MKILTHAPLVTGLLMAATAQDLSTVLPAITTLPAPAAIQEGVRLSYYGSVGDIPNEGASKWDDTAGTWNYATAPSGHGYKQVDVVGISQGFTALSVQGWQYSNWTGPLVPVRGGQSGLVCYSGGGDWWVHPDVLANLQEIRTEDFSVVKVIQNLDGVNHPAIRLIRVLPTSRHASVYDLQTGLLLFKNAAVQRANSTFVSQVFYKGSRRLPFTGNAPALPRWLRTGVQLNYQGTYTAETWGNLPFTLPLGALIDLKAVSERWFLYNQTTTLASLDGLPPTVETASLVGGGTLYIDPLKLQQLQAGIVLDTDPVTGAKLSVADKGPLVTMTVTVGDLSFTEFTYDAAVGLMTRFRSWDSTNALYSLRSELALEQMPDLAPPPRLAIGRQGKQLFLRCPDAADINVEASEDSGRTWKVVGQMRSDWEIVEPNSKRCVLFRLRR